MSEYGACYFSTESGINNDDECNDSTQCFSIKYTQTYSTRIVWIISYDKRKLCIVVESLVGILIEIQKKGFETTFLWENTLFLIITTTTRFRSLFFLGF